MIPILVTVTKMKSSFTWLKKSYQSYFSCLFAFCDTWQTIITTTFYKPSDSEQ